jgi:cell division protein ZapA
LDGSEYTIVSEESREYMLEISDLVNRKLSEVKLQNTKLSTSMAALLTALNMADDLKKSEMKYSELLEENEDLKKRLEAARQYVQNQKNQTPPNKN